MSDSTRANIRTTEPYQHITAAHKTLLWPAVINLLRQIGSPQVEEIQNLLSKGTAWLLALETNKRAEIKTTSQDSGGLDAHPSRVSTGPPTTGDFVPHAPEVFPNLNEAKLRARSQAYFEICNPMVPVIDDVTYYRESMAHVLRNGFSHGDPHSLLVLGVVALGTVAEEGVRGTPLKLEGRQSGLRGGSADQLPGREAFGAFKKRIGYVVTDTTIESVQILLLQAYVSPLCRPRQLVISDLCA